MRALTAADVIARLDLKPHSRGGHYRETFRDSRTDASGRAASTAIYYLLARDEPSHWHHIDAVEIWHYYAGSALSCILMATSDVPFFSAPILRLAKYPRPSCRRGSCDRR